MASTEAPKQDFSSWRYTLRVMGALFIPIFLETLDYTVVATAQTNIASTFHRLDLQSYIGTAYVLTSTVFLPIFASFADVFGRHSAMQLSLVFFLVGSAISTGASEMIAMLVGRGVAGIGAAGLLTVVRVILADSASLNANNIQSAVLVVLYAAGYSVGPILGGVLISVSYRWVFGINLPLSVLSMLIIFILLRGHVKGALPARPAEIKYNHGEPIKRTFGQKLLRLDLFGAFLFIAGGILFLLALNWGSTDAWSDARVIVCFILAGLLYIAFVMWEWVIEPAEDDYLRKRENWAPAWTKGVDPMIPLGMFKNYAVVVTCFAAMASGMVMLGMFYFLAIFYVVVSGLDSKSAGVQLVYFAPGIGGGVITSIFLIKHLRQPKYPIILSQVVLTVSLGLITWGMEHNNQAQVNGFMIMSGAGVGLGFGPLAIQARFSLPERRVAAVTALNLFFRTAGGTIGLAQLSAVMNSRIRLYLTNLFTSGALSPSDAAQLGAAVSAGLTSLDSISQLSPTIAGYIKDAFNDGVRWAFISLIPWCAVSAILVLFLKPIPDTDLQAGRRVDLDEEKVIGTPGSEVNPDHGVEDSHQNREGSVPTQPTAKKEGSAQEV